MATLHRPTKDLQEVRTHVAFFHGLNGSYESTFLSSGVPPELWPNWLDDLGDGVAVWGVSYGAASSQWQDGYSMALSDRAQNLLPLFANEPELAIGDLVFIGHSLGGLVIKQLLRLANDESANDTRIGNFVRRVRKVGFIATPHFGSDQGTLANSLALMFRPRETTAGLRRNDANLRNLNQWYRTFSHKHEIQNLVLYETQPVRIGVGLPFKRRGFSIGTIVKSDSSDPGLPQPVTIIPIDADHRSIVHPIDRSAEVYFHIRDFVGEPLKGHHSDTYLGERLESLKVAIEGQVEAITETITAVGAGTENRVVAEELERRLVRLRKLRYTDGFDAAKQTSRLFEDLINGELAAATKNAKRWVCAWCSRIVSNADPILAQTMLDAANRFGTGDENVIAAACLKVHRDQDKTTALAILSSMKTPLARSVSLILAGHGLSRIETLTWLDRSGLSITDLDADGKFVVLERRLEAGQWARALQEVDTLSDADFDASPILLTTAARVHLSAAIHDDLKSVGVSHIPINLKAFHLATDGPSLQRRRKARELFERAAQIFSELGADRVVAFVEDYALWLGLRDSSTRDEALKTLQDSMSGPPRSLRRIPFALQFGLTLDPEEVEREIDRQFTLTGGKSSEAAIARFALAHEKKNPAEVAEYIQRHRDQLIHYFQPNWIDAIQVEMLALSGQVSEARTKLAGLSDRLGRADIDELKRIIEEAGSEDPIALREAVYSKSEKIADLMVLVEMLRAKRAWTKLVTLSATLFQSTKDVSTFQTYVESLFQTGDYTQVASLAETYGELFVTAGLLSTLGWAHFRLGRIGNAKTILESLVTPINPRDTWLAVNIAVVIGDWNSLSAMVEEEWEQRSKRSAKDLLQMGQLARLAGSTRSKDLIKEAALRSNGDISILVTCYSEATNAGWEEDQEVHKWLDEAIGKSGPDGPIQRFDIKQLLDMQPSWNERENKTWEELSAGRLPTFAAGLILRRSLLDMYLIPALSNLEQPDPRKRPIVLAFSGSRRVQTINAKQIALDTTALLTLSFLGMLKVVYDHFEKILISPNLLHWLLEERQKIQFHQPSRVRAALEVKRLLNNRVLMQFEPTGGVKTELEQEVGEDLALMLDAANEEVDGDERQRIVIRPYPLHRAGTLMDQLADVSGHEAHLAGCRDLVFALRRMGQITETEEKHCITYLDLHELPWPHSPVIKEKAILYLDGLTVTYLQHLKLLDRLKAAGFTALVSVADLAEGDALVNHEAFAESAQTIIENIRSVVAESASSGKLIFGGMPAGTEVDGTVKNHPSTLFFELALIADALIIDDRALNSISAITTSAGQKGIFSTLDLLMTLVSQGVLTETQLGELHTKLRMAGMIFVPIEAQQLARWFNDTSVSKGALVETAELRSLRESIVRIRMTDILQLPQEHVWLDDTNLTLMSTLKSFWVEGMDEEAARARSNWLLSLFDLRKWGHRTLPQTGLPYQKYAAQLLLLTNLPDVPANIQESYWRWLQDAVLTQLREENDASYVPLILKVEELIEGVVKRVDEEGAEE